MERSARVFTTRTRVRYAETDASGIAYYAGYLVWFELGRIELFRELGLPYDRSLPIAETWCRYRAAARFDDLLEVRTWLAEVRSKGFRLAGEVWRLGDGGEPRLLAEGYTAMVTTDDQRRPAPLPELFAAAFSAIGAR